MSTAHRPTWAPAMGRESKIGSKAVAVQAINNQTKLKFRAPGQTSSNEVARRDLKAELAKAEREARDRRRKEAGLPAILDEVEDVKPVKRIEGTGGASVTPAQKRAAEQDPENEDEDEGARKRRKLLEALNADDDDDDSDSDEDEDGPGTKQDKGKGKASNGGDGDMQVDGQVPATGDDESDSDSDSDEEDEEEETRALMAELAKIKRERAEEKERQEREAAASSSADRATEIATGNPFLNLAAALGQTPSHAGNGNETPRSTFGGSQTGTSVSGFTVKRRWDDDLIFKNQASGVDEKPKKEFVNDLLRSEFHRKFMSK